MADRIADERLREIVADDDDYAEARTMAAELLAARGDLREAVELLRASRKDRLTIAIAEALQWQGRDRDFVSQSDARWTRTDALLAKHKETP